MLEPDDFGAFSVLVVGFERRAFVSAVDEIGSVIDDGHVAVDLDAVRRLVGDRWDDARWRSGLDGMLSYARSRGWITDSGAVRAHVEHGD
jgi:hypothetical protein